MIKANENGIEFIGMTTLEGPFGKPTIGYECNVIIFEIDGKQYLRVSLQRTGELLYWQSLPENKIVSEKQYSKYEAAIKEKYQHREYISDITISHKEINPDQFLDLSRLK